ARVAGPASNRARRKALLADRGRQSRSELAAPAAGLDAAAGSVTSAACAHGALARATHDAAHDARDVEPAVAAGGARSAAERARARCDARIRRHARSAAERACGAAVLGTALEAAEHTGRRAVGR